MEQQNLIDAEFKDVTPAEEKKEQKAQSPVLVKIDKSGIMNFANQIELSNAAKFAIHMKLAPEGLRKEGVEAVMAALTLCRQFKLPLSAMNEMAFIKGKVTCYGSLVTALAERHPEYGEMKVIFIDEAQEQICLQNKNLKAEVWACVIQTRKKNETEWNEFFFTMDDVKAAGISNDNYKKYRKDMLYHKAKNRALRTNYASALQGIEYHEDAFYSEDRGEKTVGAEGMNNRLGLSAGSEE